MERKRTGHFEPMPKKQLRRIIKAFRKQGGLIIMDEWAQKMLEEQNAEGITLNASTILLAKKPSRSAVFEELIHATQYRLDENDGSYESRLKCEIFAKEKLIKYSKPYKLTQDEVYSTELLLKSYIQELEEYRRCI